MIRLKELRLQRRLKQSELAELLHVKQNTISNWENGKTEINNSDAIKLANFFGISVDYLLGVSQEKEPEYLGIEKTPPGETEGANEWMQLYYALTDENKALLVKLVSSFKDMSPERRRFVLDAIRLAQKQ